MRKPKHPGNVALPAPAPDLPALAVACPRCGSAPGELCTSHGGTRQRRGDVHQARTTAYRQESADE